jgi:6-hydroxycyclohex-1-ene-1-carbonyl-CoA dehydrogenase
MKAALYTGTPTLEIQEVPTPTLEAGEVLVRVAACGVCHTDLHYLDHGVPTFKKPPLILGHEASGTIESVADGVEQWVPGDRVLLPAVVSCGTCFFCRTGRENICQEMRMFGNHMDGAYAEFVKAPAKDIFRIPDELDLQTSSIIADAVSTPYHAVKNRGQVRAGDQVVIFGCGGVGLNLVQIANVFGASVIAVDLEDTRLEKAKELGAVHTINAKGVDRIDKVIKKMTGGGADIAFEAIGYKGTIEQAFSCVRIGGRLVIVGYTADSVELSAAKIMFNEIEVMGSLGCRMVDYPPLLRLVAEGKVQVAPLVTHRVPLDDINTAMDYLRNHEGIRNIVVPE